MNAPAVIPSVSPILHTSVGTTHHAVRKPPQPTAATTNGSVDGTRVSMRVSGLLLGLFALPGFETRGRRQPHLGKGPVRNRAPRLAKPLQ